MHVLGIAERPHVPPVSPQNRASRSTTMPSIRDGNGQSPLKVIIAGAGIGGLVTAIALHAVGADIHIYEAARELKTAGVGINLQPHAVLVLRNLGLFDDLDEQGIQSSEVVYMNCHGQQILTEKRGKGAGYEVPQISIHRGEFHALLLRKAKALLGESRIHLGHAFQSFKDNGDSVTVKFIDRYTNRDIGTATGDVLIACDGINSAARKQLYPDEGPAKFSGRMLWRASVEDTPFLTGTSMLWAGRADKKFIAYPISKPAMLRGKSLINWIAELRIRPIDDPDTTPPTKADWTKSVPKETFAPEFSEWDFGWLSVPDLIEKGTEVFEFPMCDRDPIDRWSFGRMTLLGDAAHPMYPIGSNGASQAILDAECLAHVLSSESDVVKALQIYDETRRPPTSAIVYANRGQGPDYVMQLCHERCPDGWKTEDGVESVIPRTELEEIGQRYKRVAGFDVESVNEKARRTANSNGYGLQRTVAHESQKAENVAQKVQAGVELN
jgi:2-polyprenyl-6-methoxyphenol hydroxylase-like FAD-dependent oxidoreductase